MSEIKRRKFKRRNILNQFYAFAQHQLLKLISTRRPNLSRLRELSVGGFGRQDTASCLRLAHAVDWKFNEIRDMLNYLTREHDDVSEGCWLARHSDFKFSPRHVLGRAFFRSERKTRGNSLAHSRNKSERKSRRGKISSHLSVRREILGSPVEVELNVCGWSRFEWNDFCSNWRENRKKIYEEEEEKLVSLNRILPPPKKLFNFFFTVVGKALRKLRQMSSVPPTTSFRLCVWMQLMLWIVKQRWKFRSSWGEI